MLRRNGYVLEQLLSPPVVYATREFEDLIAQKLEGPDQGTLTAADLPLHEAEYQRLTSKLEEAFKASTLPEMPSARID